MPTGPLSRRSDYLKVRDRSSWEFVSVSASAAVDVADGGTIRGVRMALGGLAVKPGMSERQPNDRPAIVRTTGTHWSGSRTSLSKAPGRGPAMPLTSRGRARRSYAPSRRAAIVRAFQTLAEHYASVLRLDAAEGVIDGRGHLSTNHHNPMEPARV